MKVYFIGAGPGAADLITLRGARILGMAKMVLYAGSLVPVEMLAHCHPDAEIFDTAELNLEQQQACYLRAREQNLDVARLHSGDPAIYGATAEQMRRLEQMGIAYEIVPGVSSFTAAAAVLGAELTRPAVTQSIVITRVSGRASAVPELEAIETWARHRASMCIFLSGPHLKKIVADLRLHYPPQTPVALVYRASWPDQRSHRSTLDKLLSEVKVKDWQLTTMMLVGEVLANQPGVESSLYAANFTHRFRRASVRKRRASAQAAALADQAVDCAALEPTAGDGT